MQDNYSGAIRKVTLELCSLMSLCSLWGRDLLKDMGFKWRNEYSPVSQKIMNGMGFYPDYGIGKFLQGRKDPLNAQQRCLRQGLGFP